MKNVFIWIGVAIIIAATIIGQFTGIAVAQWIELAGFAIGLATCIVGIVSKSEKKDWKLYASIAGIVIGSGLLVFAGLAEGTITTLISLVAGVVALIISILPAVLKEK
jgi:hypothetical protein